MAALTVALLDVTGGATMAATATGGPPGASSPTPQAGESLQNLCGLTPGMAGAVCYAAGGVIGSAGAIVGSGVDAVLGAVVSFVVDGAGWLLDQVVSFIEASTSPDVQADWFRAAYGDMAVIAMLGLLPFLLLALVQALVRQDAGLMLRAAFGYVPLAAIGTAAAVVVVDLLVQLTDQLSAWVGRGLGSDLSAFATGVGTALAVMAVPVGGAVAGLAALIGAGLVAFAAFVIWLELLLRQAAIYVAVLFLPLGFMAMVWPATAHWIRRLTQGLVAIILSKFVIVAVMALAASALDADVADEGFGVVVSGGALLALAALSPYVLLRLIPVFDAGLSSELEGTFRRPTAAVGAPVTGSQTVGMLRQRTGGHSTSAGAPPATNGGGASRSSSAVGSAAGAGTAAGITAVAAGAAGARTAASSGLDRAGRAADAAARGDGSSSSTPGVARPSNSNMVNRVARTARDEAGSEDRP